MEEHAALRERAFADPEFLAWRDGLPVVVVDGEELRVVHGDRLVDDDQLVQEWVERCRPEWLAQDEPEPAPPPEPPEPPEPAPPSR